MATDKITTLHPKNDTSTNLYPNVKSSNIIDKDTTSFIEGHVPDSKLVQSSLNDLAEHESDRMDSIQADVNQNIKSITNLKTQLSTETTKREEADANLTTEITELNSTLTDEINERENSDNAIRNDFEDADKNLQTKITSLTTDLTNETSAREKADSSIQEDITTINTSLLSTNSRVNDLENDVVYIDNEQIVTGTKHFKSGNSDNENIVMYPADTILEKPATFKGLTTFENDVKFNKVPTFDNDTFMYIDNEQTITGTKHFKSGNSDNENIVMYPADTILEKPATFKGLTTFENDVNFNTKCNLKIKQMAVNLNDYSILNYEYIRSNAFLGYSKDVSLTKVSGNKFKLSSIIKTPNNYFVTGYFSLNNVYYNFSFYIYCSGNTRVSFIVNYGSTSDDVANCFAYLENDYLIIDLDNVQNEITSVISSVYVRL